MTAAPRLGHVALAATDPQRLGAFYRDMLDLQIVRDTNHPLAGHEIQLSGHPSEADHELVFFTNPQARHTAFRVDSRKQLVAYYARARERGVEIPYGHDTGRAISFFIRDPENNLVEIYWATGRPGRESPPISDAAGIDSLITGA
jgi:catechol 2,3-dioxygenase-like lactoylglutathione lyase family enzyme